MSKLQSRVFLGKIFTLITGTAFSQLIGIFASLILTRLYTPQDFGVYGTFSSLVNIGMIFATWRYEQELVISRSKSERHGLIALLLILSFTSILVAFMIAKVMAVIISPNIPLHFVLSNWALLAAIALGFSGLQFSFKHLALKEKAFQVISVSQIIQVSSASIIQIVFKLLPGTQGSIGLVIGMVSGFGLYLLYMSRLAWKCQWFDFQKYHFSLLRVLTVAKRNLIYPKFMTWSSFCNSASFEAPILILGFLFPQEALGYFFLSQRVIRIPFGLITQSISQVTFQEGSEVSALRLAQIYYERVRQFAFVGILLFGTLLITAPTLFRLGFGDSWNEAGTLTQLLLPGLFIQFIFTPFTSFFTILKEQRVYLIWSIVRLTLVCLGTFLGAITFMSIQGAAIGYSIATALSFLLQHYLLSNLLNSYNNEMTTKVLSR